MRFVLGSKIHNCRVTQANLEYVGSITIPPELIRAADLWEGEKVLVVSNTSGARLETYVIAGEDGSHDICMNGAAAHLITEGEQIIVMAFRATEKPIQPKVVLANDRNEFVRYLAERPMVRPEEC